MLKEFELAVMAAKTNYRKERYRNPTYIIMNNNTYLFVRDRVRRRRQFGLIDKKIYMGLYIAIDNELENRQFILAG